VKESKAVLNDFILETLKTVLNDPTITKSMLYDGRTQKDSIDEMLRLELIREIFHSRYNKRTIEITDKGRSILRKMESIKAELNGELEPIESENNYGTSKESVSVMRKT